MTICYLQRVEAAILLRDGVGITQAGIEGHQHLAVHGVVADDHHRAASVVPGDVGQARDGPVPDRRPRLDTRRIIDRADRSITESRLVPVHCP